MQGLPDYFYPRSPCGERRGSGTTCIAAPTFLSTLSLRRATSLTRTPSAVTPISIHALLAESDATGVRVIKRYKYFYPRSPCGERPGQVNWNVVLFCISIHALLAESDRWLRIFSHPMSYFYPRSPCGERRCGTSAIPWLRNFYPRSPCGERPTPAPPRPRMAIFLSTLSLRRATAAEHLSHGVKVISIHALLAESDTRPIPAVTSVANFYPRSPCGERREKGANNHTEQQISIHALLAESD